MPKSIRFADLPEPVRNLMGPFIEELFSLVCAKEEFSDSYKRLFRTIEECRDSMTEEQKEFFNDIDMESDHSEIYAMIDDGLYT